MNDTTLAQLKILVERAVRPVRASTSRKRKMREELLAHVGGVFEEEAKHGDESTALVRTAQRFGAPADLTRQLHAAVPAGDAPAYFVESFLGVPSHEPVLRRALRYAGLVAAFCAVCLPILIVLIGPWSGWSTIARLPSLLAPVWMAGLTFCATILEHLMRQALLGPGGRKWLRTFSIGVATWLLVPGLSLAWSIVVTGALTASVLDTLPLLLSGLLAPVALVIIVCACISEIRYLEEWANLPVDTNRGATA